MKPGVQDNDEASVALAQLISDSVPALPETSGPALDAQTIASSSSTPGDVGVPSTGVAPLATSSTGSYSSRFIIIDSIAHARLHFLRNRQVQIQTDLIVCAQELLRAERKLRALAEREGEDVSDWLPLLLHGE
ncbi:hypothetical protein A0H81_02907 [Grifola frondosa]|uniref:Uncharacterized protein n=1 Tax=Grifola frondosa TaxID=5627 RepID=A0A1C7MTI1_GRIFR|nr:hypothetical protein A0H81_02907 [Grifola frondosa]